MQGIRRRIVQIDALLSGVERHPDDALIVVDLLLASTTLVTSAAQGRTTLVARNAQAARRQAQGLVDPLFAAEAGGGGESLESTAGPVYLSSLAHAKRPLVFVCPTAELLEGAHRSPAVYVACLRNMTASVSAASLRHDRVTVIAAGYGREERSEDQMVAAMMAGLFMERGYEAGDLRTAREVTRWSGADRSVLELGRGADQLRRMGHDADLSFAVSRVDDLDLVCLYGDQEVRATVPVAPSLEIAAAAL